MKNWKTTVIGVISGAVYMFLSALGQGVKPKDAAIGIGLALLGTVAKDHNVTGGTTPQ